MASQSPSAFAVLMSSARAKAAAEKKKALLRSQSQSQSKSEAHSPTKRKTPEPSAKTVDSEQAPELKKVRAEDRVAEMKRKISLLKKKAGEFDPKLVACWEKGEKVPFAFLCLAFDLIANEKVRIVIVDIVCSILRIVMDTSPEDLVAVVYLLENKIAPAREGMELGIREATLIKAVANAYGRAETKVRKQYKESGDLVLVAQAVAAEAKAKAVAAEWKAKARRSSQSMMPKPEPLTIAKVFSTFQLIAKESGNNSQDMKKNHIKELLAAAIDCEPQYLIRLLQSKLEIGLPEETLLAALGPAVVYTEEHSKSPADIQSFPKEIVDLIAEGMKSHFLELNTELFNCIECLDPRDSFAKFNVDKLVSLAKLYPEEFSWIDDYGLLPFELKNYIRFVTTGFYKDTFSSLEDLESLAKKMVEECVHTTFILVFRLIELGVLYSRMHVTFCKFADYLK